MKVSYSHLIKHIKENPKLNHLSKKLFQLGHEHDVFENIFDIELTPNRGDCLSLRGLLRDLNLFYDTNYNNNKLYEKVIDNFDFLFLNNAHEACPKISFLKIEIESLPNCYKDELESYFVDLNLKKNNFFTDVSNYISYETGQPTHCYESTKIESGLKLVYLEENKQFRTLQDELIEINKGNLVFQNIKNEIVNLAGVMGGLNSACNKNTKCVIVECAYFNPEIIMGKAIRYALNSEAAHKFERHVDPNCHEHVLRRFLKVVDDHSNIKNVQLYSNSYIPILDKKLDLDTGKINNILGTEIRDADCKSYLNKLGLKVKGSSIHIPSYRHDISSINDIAEEVARAKGYNNIKPIKFHILSKDSKEKAVNKEIKVKNLLINNGFCEVINNPFTREKNENSIIVDNPLDSNRNFLRTNLKKSLLNNLLYNERRQQDSIKLFEISDVYNSSSNNSERFIGIIVSGRVDNNYIDFSRKLDMKYLSNFLREYLDKKTVFKCEVISKNDLKSKSKNEIVYTEIELNEDFELNYSDDKNIFSRIDFKYVPISDFPSSIRDLSFSVTDFSKSDQLQKYLLNFEDKILKQVFIFDYFFNEKRSEIKIGFRLIFQSTESTITEKEVNRVINKIIKFTSTIKGIEIPGLK